MCEPRCECIKGYARDYRTGQCIPKDECNSPPLCPENEELVCTTCSEPSCSEHEIMCWGTASSATSVTDGCVDHEACYCIPGFKRMYNSDDPADRGVCVPEHECPVHECGPHEHFEDCTIPCWEEMCCPDGNDIDGTSCVVGGDCEDACHAMCVCDIGYIRDQQGNCVESCNGNPNDGQCPGIMIWNDCGNPCNDLYCCPDGTGNFACDGTGDYACPDGCEPRCECPQGMVPNSDFPEGCIIYEEACGIETVPVECGENAFWNECGNPCNDHFCCEWDLDCMNSETSGCPAVCQGRCECHEGFKLVNGQCTPIEEACTPKCLMENEVWDTCANHCEERYCCDTNDKGHCKNDNCPNECYPMCTCETGYARDPRTNHCIPKADCVFDPICPENEHFTDHKSDCDEPKCSANDGCVGLPLGCTCNDGFVRHEGRCIPEVECQIQKCENNDPFAMYVEDYCHVELYCCDGGLCGFNRFIINDPTTTSSTTTATTVGTPSEGGVGCNNLFTGCTCQPGFAWDMRKGRVIIRVLRFSYTNRYVLIDFNLISNPRFV